jgi:hypothetical protein
VKIKVDFKQGKVKSTILDWDQMLFKEGVFKRLPHEGANHLYCELLENMRFISIGNGSLPLLLRLDDLTISSPIMDDDEYEFSTYSGTTDRFAISTY